MASVPNTEEPFRLQDLPPELRVQVYNRLIHNDGLQPVFSSEEGILYKKIDLDPEILLLRQTCRQIKTEVELEMYRHGVGRGNPILYIELGYFHYVSGTWSEDIDRSFLLGRLL